MSLGYQYAMVPVTTMEYRNVYVFEDMVHFFVPYAVCSLVALVYVVVGIFALKRNGVPATDGGFLQIMMATRGRTEMEELVLKTGFVGTKNLPKELLDMQVRLGGMVAEIEHVSGETEVRQLVGFGTMEETVSLRKMGQSRAAKGDEEAR